MKTDSTGKRIGLREFNARKRADLSGLLNAVHGTRKVTSIEMVEHEEGTRQMVVLTCTCGVATQIAPSVYKREGVGRCKACGGSGQPREKAPKVRAKPKHHDYEAWLNKTTSGFVIEAFDKNPRPVFTLRCPSGHRFPRLAWDIVTGSDRKAKRCPVCTNQPPRVVEVDRSSADDVAPEVCDCTFFNGVLRRACRWHRDDLRGAA